MTGHTVLLGLALVQADQQEVLFYCVVYAPWFWLNTS
jgi:hypothetical protein